VESVFAVETGSVRERVGLTALPAALGWNFASYSVAICHPLSPIENAITAFVGVPW